MSASTSKVGPSKQSVELSDPNNQPNLWTSDHSDAQPMETDFCGPSLPPRLSQTTQSKHGSEPSDHPSEHSEQPKRVCSKYTQNTSHSLHLQRRISPLSLLKSLLSPKRLLLSKTNNKITQTQSFTGT